MGILAKIYKMSNKKLKVDFEQKQYDKDLGIFEATKNELQKIINDIKTLNLNINLDNGDLETLINSPKIFFCNKLVDEGIIINGIKLNKEKIFDLMEIPNGLNNIIENIITLKNAVISKIRNLYIENLNTNFTITNGKVDISENTLSELKELHTIYLENENQIKVFNLLTEIKNKIKEIKEIDPRYYIENLFDDYYTIRGQNDISIDIYYIKKIK
jgi:hypothetical protein